MILPLIILIIIILVVWFLFAAIAKGLDNRYYYSDKNFLENDKKSLQSDSCNTVDNSETSESNVQRD